MGRSPFAVDTAPNMGVTISLYFALSMKGYFRSRSQSDRTMFFSLSHEIVTLESPMKRGSMSGVKLCCGSQCRASPLSMTPLTARNASTPPAAVTACLTRSTGATFCAETTEDADEKHNAATLKDSKYLISHFPRFGLDHRIPAAI